MKKKQPLLSMGLNSAKDMRKELWEIQGLLWIITAKQLDNNIAQFIFFWYGVFVLIYAMSKVIINKPVKQSNKE